MVMLVGVWYDDLVYSIRKKVNLVEKNKYY